MMCHLTKHQNSGNPHPHNCNQYKSCIFLVDCKVDDWSAWGVCSVTCGSGTKSKGRDVVQEPNPLGAMCPHLEETSVCNTDECKGTFLYLGSDLWVRTQDVSHRACADCDVTLIDQDRNSIPTDEINRAIFVYTLYIFRTRDINRSVHRNLERN